MSATQLTVMTDCLDEKGFFDPRYTCDFDNSSPELRWADAPEETESFAVIAEDLDSSQGQGQGPFSHWVVYSIPKEIRHLPAGIPPQETLPNGIRQGINGFGKLGYAGPCPPFRDRAHRYVFRVYALRASPEIPFRATREQLMQVIEPYILSSGAIEGRYERLAQKAG